MPASRATAFDRLAPDQRAAVELVLRQGRSYGELSELLGMPEETIRTRARSGLAALAPDLPAPARSGEIADWLLGQQAAAHAARTREFLLADPAANRWAATVAAPLREIPGGDSVPDLPTGTDAAPPRVNGKHAAPRGDEDASPAARAASRRRHGRRGGRRRRRADGARGDDSSPRGRSSRLGGALLLGGALVIVAVVVLFVVLGGGKDNSGTTADDSPSSTVAATATPAVTVSPDAIVLKGPIGSKSVGLMQLVRTNDNTVRFALAGQDITPNKPGEVYSLWFTKKNGDAQLLGDISQPVGSNGQLLSAGPGNADVAKFPDWYASYDSVLVTLDEKGSKKPGEVILKGDLPHGQSGGYPAARRAPRRPGGLRSLPGFITPAGSQRVFRVRRSSSPSSPTSSPR